ncbi:adenylosuccinate synthetase [Inquilinus limosus]|uniref:Adenylosuccinate synthetase n=1 Tax=Inquilinus limosus MP06 TaxID=1398085 RepID=A0A0A0DBG3_9PROT|nr:adenylosuccinate synthetase [Inquilinus limosus]KGM36056.1 hypothetical protein P409_00880 [Inquilinus limosus MP06]
MKAYAVIGAGFGDEGKGLVTDHLVARLGADTLVVRFNGGAQAGHTVTLPDGRRHVFSHFGSGSLLGAPTFLSRFFIANPTLFAAERQRLTALSIAPAVLIDPRCVVTTPYDMVLNQAMERPRSGSRHGSCGVGIGETVERSLHPGFRLTVADLADEARVRNRLEAIRRNWVPARLATLRQVMPAADLGADREVAAFLASDLVVERTMADIAEFLRHVSVAAEPPGLSGRPLVLEGAQGLLLDQDLGWFPHVTRSHTGLRNVAALARDWRLRSIEPIYVSRVYATRHGAGPLPHETAGIPGLRFEDRTNVPHPYQGAIRLAPLDLDLVADVVRRDRLLASLPSGVAVTPRLVVTCVDQLDRPIPHVDRGEIVEAGPETVARRLADRVGTGLLAIGAGPTWATMTLA